MKVLLHFPDAGPQAVSMLTRALIERGHEVAYTSIDHEDATSRPADAARVAIHSRWPMRSLLTRMREAATGAERDWLRLEVEAYVARDYFDGEMTAHVQTIAPDLIVADTALVSPLQFVAHELRVPCAQLSLTFSRRFLAGPPLNSSLDQASSPLQLAGAQWQGSCLNRRVADFPVPMQIAAAIERLATSFGYPATEVSFDSVQFPALTLFPEMISCEASLDWNTPAAPGSNYLAIEPPRAAPQEVPAALGAFVDPGRPLIYMDIGGRDSDSALFEGLWRPLTESLAGPTPWKTVVVAGSEARAAQLSVRGDDILVLVHAPSSWLLQRAAAYVTTADLDAVRAAIAQRVPMIAIPVRDDQPGNAERVVHHGAGVRLRAELLTSDVLHAAIRDVLANAATLRQNLRRLDLACREERASHRGVEALEKLVDARGASAARSAPSTPRPCISPRFEESRLVTGMDEAWFDYASWCVASVLEPLWVREPDRVEAFRDLMSQYREARHCGDERALDHWRRAACERAASHWHKGYGAVVCALHPDPQRGAWLARLEVAAVLARAVATHPLEAARSQQFMQRYAEVSRQLDDEWQRRVGGRARIAL